MLITLLATAVVLGVLIFVHELGHFVTAKLVDIEVPRFSIGFGPKVIGFRRGETEYVLSLLPLGGYVKMAGLEEMEAIEGGPSKPRPDPAAGGAATDVDAPTDTTSPADPSAPRPRDFESKSLPARTLVISAGVIMNMLFAFGAFAFIALVWGVPQIPPPEIGSVTEELLPESAVALAELPIGTRITGVGERDIEDFDDLRFALTTARPGPVEIRFADRAPMTIGVPEGDSARFALASALEPVTTIGPVLETVTPDAPAGQAGLRDGDVVVSAAGRPMTTWQEFVAVIEASPGRPVPVVVDRDGTRVEATVTPDARSLGGHAYGRIGVAAMPVQSGLARERVGPVGALGYGAVETWDMAALTVDFLGGIITGRESARNVGGPILIGELSGRVARDGPETFLGFMALLSINLAILNLLPIPVLDGGHLVFLGIEAVRGRGLSLDQRMRLSQVGFVMILLIMAWAIGNDVLRLIGI
jgi:regulator of sigma E protease